MSALAKKSTTPLHRNDREALKEQIRCCAYELYTSEAVKTGHGFLRFPSSFVPRRCRLVRSSYSKFKVGGHNPFVELARNGDWPHSRA